MIRSRSKKFPARIPWEAILFSLLILGIIGARCNEKEYRSQLSIDTWAGEGIQGDDGDDHYRTKSWFNHPMEMVFGLDGLAYIIDWNNHRVRRVKPDGRLETLIGTVLPGDWPCQNPADPVNCEVPLNESIMGLKLSLNHPTDIVFASEETAYISAWHNHKVYQYSLRTGVVSIIAGQQLPGFTGDGGPAVDAKLNLPAALSIDANGNLFVSDERNNRIRRIANNADRVIMTVVGSSDPSIVAGYGGDGGPATAARLALTAYHESDGMDNPPPGGGLAMDEAGHLYIADTFNHCVRKVVPGQDGVIGEGHSSEEIIITVAGTCGVAGFRGDGGSAVRARLNRPYDLAFGSDGWLYVADTHNHVIRSIDLATGIIRSVAGTGAAGFSGDSGPAILSKLRYPYGISFSPEGHLYIIDTSNNRVRVVAKQDRERHG